MRSPRSLKSWVLALVCVSSLTISLARAADVPNKKEIITQARRSYYSLRDRGLVEFQSTVQPNWRLVLKDQIAANPEGAEGH